MSSSLDFRSDLDRALAAYREAGVTNVSVDWQNRPVRSGGSWVLTVRLGANIVTADLHALPGDQEAALTEARRLLTSR